MSPSKHYCLPVLCSAGVRFPRSSTSKQRNREGATSPTASFTIQDKTPQPQISGLQTNLTNKPDPDAYMASEFHSPMRFFFFLRTPWEISLFRDQHGLNHMVNGVFVKDSCPSRHAPAHLSLINLCSLDQADAFSTTHKPKQRASHNIPKSETFSLCSDRTPNNDPSPLTALLSLDRTVNRKNTVPPPPNI